ncbi:MAG: dTDP-4-dehydrorhamnose reductase [Microbacteriaceae bacterium]|nr:dTDP-4-dehydrorhamnose reductase [Microbacteriaceae bacterium]
MSRVAVVGAAGMLGSDLLAALAAPGSRSEPGSLSEAQPSRRGESKGFTRADFDVSDVDAAREALAGFDVIVNCTAWNRVDDAETMEAEAFAVNADGPASLAAAAAATGARLIHVSTDYVFDGTATSPIAEDAPRHPVSAYGRSKAAGEERAIAGNPGATAIVRTAWLYGEHGPSFPRTMLRLAAERETVSVVTDQIGQPTWTGDLAEQLVRLIEAGVPAGIYHGTNSGAVSWHGFARETFRLAGLDPERVLPTDSGAFVRPAPRPAYSVLGHDAWVRIGLAPMRPWQEALAAAFEAGALPR